MKIFIKVLIASASLISCNVWPGESVTGNGNIHEEKRNISTFNTVKNLSSIDLEINSGESYSLSVEDDENILPYIITEVDGGILNIHYKNNTNINNDHAKVTITAPSINKIISSGSGDISGNGIIRNSSQIEFNLSGSGDVDAKVDAPSIKVSASGSGNIKLAGRTKDFDCRVSGSGDVNCSNLQSENTTISISGSGNAHVFASVHLTAKISGSGDVYYLGNPQSPEIHTTGSGIVQAQK